jgi:hypothetical protein
LGEFSPIGRLLALTSIMTITEVAQIIGLLFPTVKKNAVMLTKNWLGYILDFFSQIHLAPML